LRRSFTPVDARRALARVHGFEPFRETDSHDGTLAVLKRHQSIQSDPIDVAGRNADLTLQARIGEYRRETLVDLLYKERRLFEYFCKMQSIMPVELFSIFKHKMNAFLKEKRVVSFFRKHRKETRLVLKALEKGPVSSREFADMGRMDSGWGHTANISNMILMRLWVSGKALIHSRNGAARYYALPEQVIPRRILNKAPPSKGEDVVEIAKIIVNASRLVMAGGAPEQWWEVGKTKEVRGILKRLEKRGELTSIQLQGLKEKLYIPSNDLHEWEAPEVPSEDYVRFLAPLDPLLWSRRVFRSVYGREYFWEVYKRPKDRKYGYYCLPVMFNDEYVGLLNPFFRKNDKVLEIRDFHILDPNLSRGRFLNALHAETKRFSNYVGAEKTEVKRAPHWTKGALLAN
jgi:uncharacterized protein YcaQ